MIKQRLNIADSHKFPYKKRVRLLYIRNLYNEKLFSTAQTVN